MAYNVTLKKRAIKTLAKISEPYYSNVKEAIYSLADNKDQQLQKAKRQGRLSYPRG